MQHARNSTGALARAALAVGARPGVGAGPAGTDAMLAAVRGIGQVGVPENYGQVKDGPGTKFLGTPANHRELLEKRPLSPDVLDIDGSTHYKFPIVALSSITNRVTGCVLSGAVAFGGTLSAVGGPEALPYFIEGFKSTVPFLVFPTKALIGFPFVYHTLGGFRHMVWDKTTNGIDNASARASSIGLFAASGAVTAALASMSF